MLFIIVLSSSCSSTGDKAKRLESNNAEITGGAKFTLHAIACIFGSTVRALSANIPQVYGSECLTVNGKRLRLVVVQLVFIPSHLFALLTDFLSFLLQLGILLIGHVRQLQKTTRKAGGEDKVLVLECGSHRGPECKKKMHWL